MCVCVCVYVYTRVLLLVQHAVPLPTLSGVLCHVLALYTYNAENNDELTFHKGSVIGVLSKDSGDWWYGDINGRQGLFPSNYVQSLDDLLPVPGSKCELCIHVCAS